MGTKFNTGMNLDSQDVKTPARYDEATGKWVIDVELSGSTVQTLAVTLPYAVAAGANVSLVGVLDVTKYRRVTVAVALDASKASTVNIRERTPGSNPLFDNAISATSSKHVQNIQPRLSNVDVYYSNTDTTSVNITNVEVMCWNMA
jgi:hypothetical protein